MAVKSVKKVSEAVKLISENSEKNCNCFIEQSEFDSNVSVRITKQELRTLNIVQRIALAKSEDTPEDIVYCLADDVSFEVRRTVANRKVLSSKVIGYLVKHIDEPAINYIISKRKDLNLHEDVLMDLACSWKYEDIRENVASRKDLTEKVIEFLSNDPCERVRRDLAANCYIPMKYTVLFANSEDFDLRYGLAMRNNLPLEIVMKLAKDCHVSVRECIALRQNLHPKVLSILLDDKCGRVHDIALKRKAKLNHDQVR